MRFNSFGSVAVSAALLLATARTATPADMSRLLAVTPETWDSRYLQEQIKSEQYNSDSQAVRPYFEYGRVQRGVMDVAGRMFGLGFSSRPGCRRVA